MKHTYLSENKNNFSKLSVLTVIIYLSLTIPAFSQEKSGILEPVINNNIVSLDIDVNSNGEIASNIFQFTNLEELRISGNESTIISNEIRKLYALQILDLSNAQVNELPEEISQLRLLQEIHLNYEKWQYRQDEVKRITRAKIILK